MQICGSYWQHPQKQGNLSFVSIKEVVFSPRRVFNVSFLELGLKPFFRFRYHIRIFAKIACTNIRQFANVLTKKATCQQHVKIWSHFCENFRITRYFCRFSVKSRMIFAKIVVFTKICEIFVRGKCARQFEIEIFW